MIEIFTKTIYIFVFFKPITYRFNDNEEHVLSDMGTSQSKRSNKISKLRTSSVGTVGDSEENKGNGNSSSSGKLFSIKGWNL